MSEGNRELMYEKEKEALKQSEVALDRVIENWSKWKEQSLTKWIAHHGYHIIRIVEDYERDTLGYIHGESAMLGALRIFVYEAMEGER